MDKFEDILLAHGIRPNFNRVRILKELCETEKAYSLGSLSQIVKEEMDRTTVYRTLLLLTEKRLLQKVPCTDGNTLFALDHSAEQQSNATSFRCKCCHKVENLPDLPQEYLQALSERNINLETVSLEGYCENCAK